MAWWSLTCNIAREWRLMMAEARTGLAARSAPASTGSASAKSSVIYLAEVLRIRRERRLGVGDLNLHVVYMIRGPRPRQRA